MKPRANHRGVVLIEALVALLIVAFGMVAMMGLQSSLRRSSDLARQRGEALRLAQQDMETLRAFSVLSPNDSNSPAKAQAFPGDQDTSGSPRLTSIDAPGSNTVYSLTRVVEQADPALQLRSVRVTVNWLDRSVGTPSEQPRVVLDSHIARIDPSLSAALSFAPDASPLGRPSGSNTALPAGAKYLGDGRSVYKPLTGGTLAWIFNNLTGAITSVCTVPSHSSNASLASADLRDCQDKLNGYLLSGTINFSWASPADSENPAGPALPQPLAATLVLTSTGHLLTPGFNCYSDAPVTQDPGQSFVSYSCIVFPNNDAKPVWSGFLDLRGLLFTGQAAVKVCRYSADYDGDTKISNAEHPLQYTAVNGALRNQNFLVIKAGENCPAGHGIDPSKGYFRNTITVLHQDAGTPSHAGS